MSHRAPRPWSEECGFQFQIERAFVQKNRNNKDNARDQMVHKVSTPVKYGSAVANPSGDKSNKLKTAMMEITRPTCFSNAPNGQPVQRDCIVRSCITVFTRETFLEVSKEQSDQHTRRAGVGDRRTSIIAPSVIGITAAVDAHRQCARALIDGHALCRRKHDAPTTETVFAEWLENHATGIGTTSGAPALRR